MGVVTFCAAFGLVLSSVMMWMCYRAVVRFEVRLSDVESALSSLSGDVAVSTFDVVEGEVL